MKKDINITLGKKIWDARKKAKLTREQLAEKINVSVRFLADVESGLTGVYVTTLKALCLTLDVSADYLLGIDIDEKNYDSILKKIKRIPEEKLENIEKIIDEIIKLTSN